MSWLFSLANRCKFLKFRIFKGATPSCPEIFQGPLWATLTLNAFTDNFWNPPIGSSLQPTFSGWLVSSTRNGDEYAVEYDIE